MTWISIVELNIRAGFETTLILRQDQQRAFLSIAFLTFPVI